MTGEDRDWTVCHLDTHSECVGPISIVGLESGRAMPYCEFHMNMLREFGFARPFRLLSPEEAIVYEAMKK